MSVWREGGSLIPRQYSTAGSNSSAPTVMFLGDLGDSRCSLIVSREPVALALMEGPSDGSETGTAGEDEERAG